MWDQCLNTLNRWTGYIIILFMSVLTADVVMNVVLRYLLRTSMVWVEELSIYLMIWSSFLATAVAFREGAHVAFTMLRNKLPWPIRRYVILFNEAVVLSFLGMMVYYGIVFTIINWAQHTPAMRISKGIPYLSIPVSGILMILQMTGVVMKDIQEFGKHSRDGA